MGKENSVLTIDIGSRSLRMAEFLFHDEGISLTKFLSRRIELGEEETIGAWFDYNYNDMLVKGGFTAESVRLALPSATSFQRLSKLPPTLGSSKSVSQIIEFEAAQAVPYSMHEVEWGYQLLHHEWDETVEEIDEDGNVSQVEVKNEEYEALFVALKTEEVTCYTDVIERSGKKLLSVELASLNIFNAAVVSQVKEDECTMILEIGAKGTCLMLADHRRIFMRNIPIGGDSINAQIAREFGVSDTEAEDLKRRHGFIALGGAYDEPESPLAATISKIARNVMTRLHGEISRSINVWRAQHNGNAPVRVLLAGGGSTMQYTTEFFDEKLHLPVEYLNTFSLISIDPQVDRNALQAAASMSQAMIGMALHSLGSCPVDISLIPRAIKKQYELDARKPYFYASAVAFISCLLICVVGIGLQLDFEQRRVAKVEAEVQAAKKEFESVQKLKGQLDSLRDTYEHSQKFWVARNNMSNLLTILQEQIPQRMWLIAFEPVKEAQDAEMTDDMGMGMESAAPSPDGVTAKDPNRRMTPDVFNKMPEVKKIRLAGYIMRMNSDGDRNLLHEFTENVRMIPLKADVKPAEEGAEVEKMFEDVKIEEEFADGNNNNLTYFEVVLTLKEALKK
jgi:type IV pilus assembly protein PilM